MLGRTFRSTALALMACLSVHASAVAPATTSTLPTHAPLTLAQPLDVRALDGVWIYQDDRTEGRPDEEKGPPISPRTTLRVEPDAFVVVRSDGEIRIPLDGSPTDVAREGSVSRYRGQWQDGAFAYEIESIRADGTRSNPTRIEFRPTPEGTLIRVTYDVTAGTHSLALYRHPEDIPLPTPAQAKIDDLAWLAGAWVGSRGEGNTTSIEERWSPPLGGAMLAVSRTVRGGRMRAFEYLRIVERDGGLVYVAQPGGRTATEFILTEIDDTRAVFENPRHDSPQRIVYERSPQGGLSASIGYANGGRPQRFDFTPEASQLPTPPSP